MEGKPLNDNENNLWLDVRFFDTNNINIGDLIEIIAEGKRVPYCNGKRTKPRLCLCP